VRDRAVSKPKRKVVQLECVCAGTPIPKDFCDQVERVVADMRSGKVTSFAWVAIGPDFARWENAYISGRSDRMNILGQMDTLHLQIMQKELDSPD
jgi:hypothetical protein